MSSWKRTLNIYHNTLQIRQSRTLLQIFLELRELQSFLKLIRELQNFLELRELKICICMIIEVSARFALE